MIEIVKLLLRNKYIDPATENNTAIIAASMNGHAEVVKVLIKDRDVDPSDNNNDALLLASMKNHAEVVKLLLNDKRVKVTQAILKYIRDNNLLRIMKIILADKSRDYTKILPRIEIKKKPSKEMLNLILGYIQGKITKKSLRKEEDIYSKIIRYWSEKISDNQTNLQYLKKNKSFDVSADKNEIIIKLLKSTIKDFISIYFLNIRAYLEVYPKWIKVIFQSKPKSDVSIVTIKI